MSGIHRIWSEVLAGDRLAWQQLVDLFAGLVHTVALRTGLPSDDAEDCAQHTWLSLYRNRNRIKDPAALPAWLIRTTHRQAVTLNRRLPQTTGLETIDLFPDTGPLPDDIVLKLENEALLDIGLRKMDSKCRRLLHSLFYSPEEKTYRQIARTLGVKLNSLGSLRDRCLKKLRFILEKLGYRRD